MIDEIPFEQKLIYLLEVPGRIGLLKQFFPTDGRLLLAPWCRKDGTFGDTTASKFQKGAHYLVMSERLAKAVPHAPARQLLIEWIEVKSLAAKSSLTDFSAFIDEIFVDVAIHKLGVQPRQAGPAEPEPSVTPVPPLPDDLLKALSKAAAPVLLKRDQASMVGALGTLASRVAEHRVKVDALKKEKEQAVKLALEKPASTPATETTHAGGGATGKMPPPEPAVSTAVGMAEGDTVYMIAKLKKEIYDNKKCTVLNVGALQVKVRLEEGPNKGEVNKVSPDRLRSEKKSLEEAPAAGKRPIEDGGAAERAVKAAKAAKAAAMAQAIFGTEEEESDDGEADGKGAANAAASV